LRYNLHFPIPYDTNQTYPLVQFIADSWQLGNDPRITLVQGQGATVWAEAEEQAVRPCFVLSPQFPGPTIVEDDFSVSPELDTYKALLDQVISQYPIDRSSIYTTGQSMGTLSSLEMNVRYPELFAGSLLFSGFWNPDTVKVLTDHSIWVVLSEGDHHAMECMSACMDVLEANGVSIDRAYWDGRESLAVLNELAQAQAELPGRVKFTVLKENSMVPVRYPADGASNHRCTWQLGYQLPALREWLFRQKK
jgi:predicted peptidase